MYYVDVHNRKKNPNEGGVISLHPDGLYDARQSGGNHYFSAGIMPSMLVNSTAKELERDFIRQLNQPKLLALGPAGMDTHIKVPVSLQLEIFEMQAMLAAEMQLPLLLQVKALIPDLLPLLTSLHHRSAWIIQDFNGSSEDAIAWTQQGLYLSFGARAFHSEAAADEVLAHMPLDRLFLETGFDEVPIADVYQKAADILAIENSKLQEIIYRNFHAVFGKSISELK